MMTTTTTARSEILAIAQAAAAAGDSTRARHYFRNLTEIDPGHLEAWLGYAACTAVLSERRALYARALALDPACVEALEGIAQIDTLLAAGRLVRPREAAASAPAHLAPAAPPALEAPRPVPVARASTNTTKALLAVGLIGVVTMGLLMGFGIFVLTSFWGFLLAFVAGPLVADLMVRLSGRARLPRGGRAWQIAAGLGMLLGGIGAMALGGLLLPALGLPLPADAVQMAANSGVGSQPVAVLLNNPGLLIFLSSAVAATVYRMR